MSAKRKSTLGVMKPWSWTFVEGSQGQQYGYPPHCRITAPSSEGGSYKIGTNGNPIMEPTPIQVARIDAVYISGASAIGTYDIEACKKRAQFICDLANSVEERP